MCLHSFNRTIARGAPSIKPCARPELLAPWSVGQNHLEGLSKVRGWAQPWSAWLHRSGGGPRARPSHRLPGEADVAGLGPHRQKTWARHFPPPHPSTSADSTLAGTFLGSTEACLSLPDSHPCSAVSPTKF